MANKIIGKVAMTPKGEWSATTKYAILDVVTKNDIMYVAIKDVPLGTVVTNTTYWIKLISGSGVVFDTAMSDTSENGVQNKVIKAYVDNGLGNKVDKVSGKGLSTNDYTTNEKTKLSGIETGANKTTVDSAMSSTSTNPIQNKVVNTALGNKVDKVDGKGLSTNDYTTTDKTAVGTIGNKVDKVSGKGLSTNDYTDDDKTLVGTISSKADSNNPVFTGTVTIPAQSLDCSTDGSKEVYDGGVYFDKYGNMYKPDAVNSNYFCIGSDDNGTKTNPFKVYFKTGEIVSPTLTPTSVTGFSNANTTNVSNLGSTSVYKCGKMVVLNININIKTASTSKIQLIKGLPVPNGAYFGSCGDANGKGARLKMDTDGILYSETINTGWQNGQIVYFTN